MKVLLQADVEKLGYFGDVVDVAEGYARNYLLPQRLATMPTTANVKKIESERAHQAELRRLARDQMVKAAEKVNDAEITLAERANEQGHLFGSVTEEQIAVALRDQSFEVQTKQVVMDGHFRQLGDYSVTLRYAEGITATVKVHIVPVTGQADGSQTTAETNDN